MGQGGISCLPLKDNFKKQGINRDRKTARPQESESSPRAGEAGLREGWRDEPNF